jgi:hypothetical protein
MKLFLAWKSPVSLDDGKRENLIYLPDRDRLPKDAGVYIFGRRQRNGGFEALYVGRANNIRGRVWGQRKNLPLMMHLKNARHGERLVRVGVLNPRPGQKINKCLPIIERALIRYFLSEGHNLVNTMGTRLGRHELASDGKHPNLFIPKLMYVD